MKKIFYISSVLFLTATLFSSCQKDYTCTCIVNDQQYVYTYDQETKKEAGDACDKQEAAAQIVDKKGKCDLTN